MKKLYLLLFFLILVFIVVNVYNETGFDFDTKKESLGYSSFKLPKDFKVKSKTDYTLSTYNKNKNITLNITELNNSLSIKDIFKVEIKDSTVLNQEINKINNIDVYILYRQTNYTNSTQLFLEKNNQNYVVTALNFDNNNKEYFKELFEDVINNINPSKSFIS